MQEELFIVDFFRQPNTPMSWHAKYWLKSRFKIRESFIVDLFVISVFMD